MSVFAEPRKLRLFDQLYFCLDLNRNIKWKLREADRAAAVRAGFRSEEFEDEIGETVDDARLAVESGGRVDHSENAAPCGDAVKITNRAFEAAQDRQGGEASRSVALFEADLSSDFPQRFGE